MVYLEPADYLAFGLGVETAEAWVTAASAMIDGWCRRPTLGLTSYTERLRVGRRSGTVLLSYGPVVQVTSVRARFGHTVNDVDNGGGLLAMLGSAFCTPGDWTTIHVTTLDVCAATGEVRLTANMLGAPYSEAEIVYTAGFAEVPTPVMAACAQIVKNAMATPALNVKSSRVDTLAMEYFAGSLLTADVTAMLQPWRAERLCA